MLRRTLRWTLQDFEVFLPYQFYGQYWKTGWWFGTFFVFPYIGNVIIPTDQYLSEGLTPPTRQYWKNLKHRGLVGRLFPRISPQITQTERFSWYQSFPELGRNSWTITIFCFAQNPLRRNRLFEVGMRCPVLSLLFEVLNMAMLPWRNCWVKQKWTSTFSSISIHFPQGRSLWTSLKMDTQLGRLAIQDMVEVLQHDIKTGWAHGKKAGIGRVYPRVPGPLFWQTSKYVLRYPLLNHTKPY